MKMIQNVCIFLTVALIVVSIVLAVITKWYIQLCRQWEDEGNRIETLESDNRQLLNDKRDLITRNEILYDDNVKLADAVKELRAINKELLSFEEDEETAEVQGPIPNVMPLPYKPTNVISIEDAYDPAFTPDTQQYQFQQVCKTDTDDKSPFRGARYFEHEGKRAYCSALSTNYSKHIGKVFEVELECGACFYVICGDFKNSLNDTRKDWLGTPCKNRDGEDAICVIELLSDLNELSENVKGAGNFAANERLGGLYGHGGNVVRLTEIERWWMP